MKNLIRKEFCLATHLLTFLFLGFALMTLIPGYPILCGAFFVCFGMFQSYQIGREDHDILYSVLLPVKKTDVVKAKYYAAVLLQMAAFVLFAVFTVIRMVWMWDAAVYRTNALMGANPVFLAFVLIIFAAFNGLFLGGFFKTAYGFGKPFISFSVANFIIIAVGETLHHLPGLGWLNALEAGAAGRHLPILFVAALVYAAVTAASCKASQRRFEIIDL